MPNDSTHPEHIEERPPSLWEFMHINPVTTGLLVACIGVAGWTQLGTSLTAVRWLTFVDLVDHSGTESMFPGWADGQWWGAITPIFIQFGIVHLVFNLMWLYDLGGTIESRWRARHLAVLVVISGVLANEAQYLINWDFQRGFETRDALSGGMSGVVYALFGYIWLRGRRDPALGLHLHSQTVVLMLGWLVFCMTGMMGRIGNSAHLVGLLVGVVAGFLAPQRQSQQR